MNHKIVWKILIGNRTNGSREFVYVESEELYDAFELFKKSFTSPENYIMLAWERIKVLTI